MLSDVLLHLNMYELQKILNLQVQVFNVYLYFRVTQEKTVQYLDHLGP